MEPRGRRRIRELGIVIGRLPPGRQNAITDVAGVRVGHTTLISGEGPLRPGLGPVRTGVTVILPHPDNLFSEKVPVAVHTINGFGKPTGFEQVRELGVLESPIALTNTLNVGLVMDALVQHAIAENPDIGIGTGSVNVVVGETNDGFLNDIQGRHVRAEHVWKAIQAASDGPVEEGAVGAGTGCYCLGWKGGIGTASRVLLEEQGGFTLGALVQTNFGGREDLLVQGLPAGRLLERQARKETAGPEERDRGGSIVVVLATDAPLDSRQLGRLCMRAAAGIARTGSHYGHSSGDFAIAFSTAQRIEHYPPALTSMRKILADEARGMERLFVAVVECVEEAILNSLSSAQTMTGRDGNTAYGLPLDELAGLVAGRNA